MNFFVFLFALIFFRFSTHFFKSCKAKKQQKNLKKIIQKKKRIPNKILALRIQNTKTTAFGYLTTDGGWGGRWASQNPLHNMSPLTHTTLTHTHTHACSTLSTRVCVSVCVREQIEC